jgi:hypothetical protein
MTLKEIKIDQGEATIDCSGAGAELGSRNWRTDEEALNLPGYLDFAANVE